MQCHGTVWVRGMHATLAHLMPLVRTARTQNLKHVCRPLKNPAKKLKRMKINEKRTATTQTGADHRQIAENPPVTLTFEMNDTLTLKTIAGIQADTWLTGYPRSQDPAPHKSVQIRLSLTALQFKPELYATTTLVNTHESSTNRKVEEHT